MAAQVSVPNLADALFAAAHRWPSRIAATDTNGRCVTFAEAAVNTARIAAAIDGHGVRPGDRVAVALRKSLDSLLTFYAVLRCGATYVPVDVLQPAARSAFAIADCDASLLFGERDCSETLGPELQRVGWCGRMAWLPSPDAIDPGSDAVGLPEPPPHASAPLVPDAPAFLLYTSGSTGLPKGVIVSHENVSVFIDWCSSWVMAEPTDCFAIQSPLHYSLSVFQIYLAWKHGASVLVIDDDTARTPALLAPAITKTGVTVWFSTPTILSWMVDTGLWRAEDLRSLRLVILTGERVSPSTLRELMVQVPAARFVHALGSTETHMIARYEVPPDVPRDSPIPLGTVAEHFRYRIVDEQLQDVGPGSEGELWVSGPGVTPGYWRRPIETAAAFVVDAVGQRWYRTRDIVTIVSDTLVHRGRRDRIVKKRGNRVDLAEIESCLSRHACVRQVAVVAVEHPRRGVTLNAFVVGSKGSTLSSVQLKSHCARLLPSYMVPDVFSFPRTLPQTSNGKPDLPRLSALASRRTRGGAC